MVLKVFSFGGGVQSTAALVLAAQDRIAYRTFLFCNVGEDSENPDTLTYVHEVAMPFAKAHGIDLREVRNPEGTLLERITGEANRGYVIPAFTPTKKGKRRDGAPGHRDCTVDFKIKVVDAWLVERGAKEHGALVGLGISRDEVGRIKPNMEKATMGWKTLAWPLCFDLHPPLDRQGCINVIEAAGLPIPPRSACKWCPHRPLGYWQHARLNAPELYQDGVTLEKIIGERQRARGLPVVYLTRVCKPLEKITTEDYEQASLFDDDLCESGYCFV